VKRAPRGAVLVVAVAVAVAVVATARGRGRGPAPRRDALQEAFAEDGLTAAEARGRALFGARCATCHGAEGHGDGQNAYNLEPPPPDFRESLSRVSSADRRKIVEGGTTAVGRSALCPPNGRAFRPEEVDAVLAWLAVAARAAPAEEPAPRSWRPRRHSS
jgi:mono/diheme cytochrome c family protein